MIQQYMYLHENGGLIFKYSHIVSYPHDYFDSPFVVKWWPPPKDLNEFGLQLVEALKLTKNEEKTKKQIDEIALKAGIAVRSPCAKHNINFGILGDKCTIIIDDPVKIRIDPNDETIAGHKKNKTGENK